MKPVVPNDQQRHERLRAFWAGEDSLARACWRYASVTGDAVFAVQEMVRSQLGRPLPGSWHQLPVAVAAIEGLQDAVDLALRQQRDELRGSYRRRFTALAILQQGALRDLTWAQEASTSENRGFDLLVAEARCQDLICMARLLVEQEAMRETAYQLGDDHPANLDACRGLFWAAEEALARFDRKLREGLSLAEALAVEILLESGPLSVPQE